MKTIRQVKREFARRGDTFAAWARRHGYRQSSVAAIVAGQIQGRRGIGHRIAVELGLKDGELFDSKTGRSIPRRRRNAA